MTSKHRIQLISAVVLIAAASWMGWNATYRGPDSTGAVAANGQETVGSSDEEANEVLAQEPAPASSGRVVAKSVTTPSPTSVQPTQGPPLPGLIPPAELVELLEPRARAGDAAAACRLAAELVKCRSALKWTTMSEAQISQAVANMGEDGLPEESIERSRHYYELRNLQRRQCEAIPEHLRGQAPWLYLQAAQHGNVQSMVAFAQGAGIGGAEMVADPDLYHSYRENAFHFWRQALQAGSVAAVHAWVEALQSNGFQFLAGALPEEYQDLELAIALKDEIDVAIGSGPGTPTIENLPEITRLRARAMFEQHFAGSEQLASIAQQRPSAEAIKERLAQSTERTAVISPSEAERVESLNRNCSDL